MPVVVGWASAGLADLGGGLLNGVPHHCLCGLLSFRGWLGLPTCPCRVPEGGGEDQQQADHSEALPLGPPPERAAHSTDCHHRPCT
mgnify:CR=1 FL=1